jgi:taurine--2-oxoglutarate transaminase
MVEWDRKYCMHVNSSLDELAPLSVAKTEGEYVILSDGTKLLDFLAGYISVALGQRNQRIMEEIKKAMDDYAYVPEIFVHPYKSTAAKLIINDLLGPDKWAGRIHFVSSGSEANEEALQIAKLFTNRPYIVTREYSYHGWTEGAGACTRINYQRGTLSSPKDDYVRTVPGFPAPGYFPATAPYCYRCPYGFKGPDTCKVDGKVSCLNDLEHTIKSLGPENVAAVIAEPVSGSGAIVSPRDWVRELREITQKHGILWIDDEVITGFGRMGKWFGYQHYGVTPDIMTLGKGIASSHLPASAVVISKEIADFFDRYRWHHAVTYSAHPLAMAAVVANLRQMIEDNTPERVNRVGQYLAKRLVEQETRHESIGQITGTGLLYGVEFVKSRTTREPIILADRDTNVTGDTSDWPVSIVRKRGIEKGALFTGIVPNALRLGPALTIREEQIDQAMTALDYGIREVDEGIVGKN